MSSTLGRIAALTDRLGMTVVDNDTAFGEVRGVPTTMTVLGEDPLALLVGFRVARDGDERSLLDALEDLPRDETNVSFDDGCAWLSLYNVDRLDDDAVAGVLDRLTDSLAAAGVAVGPGCLRCGDTDGAAPAYLDGRPTRICPPCVAEAGARRREAEAELNRPSLAATLGLPAMCAFVVAGWAVAWTAVEVALRRLEVNVVEINHLTTLLILALVAGTGATLGWPLGASLRRSGLIAWAPKAMSVVIVAGLVFAGEIAYVAIFLWRFAGVFDLAAAAQLLRDIVPHYTGFWAFSKLAAFASVSAFCAGAASQRAAVRLEV